MHPPKRIEMAIYSLLLLALAVELRLPAATRDIWQDEIKHNFRIVHPRTLSEATGAATSQFQPVLEMYLRRYLFIPLFGMSEAGIRVSSMLFSLLTVLLIFWWLSRQALGRDPIKATWLSVWGTTLFAIFHRSEIYYASEARHYSFVALASVIWFFTWERNIGKPFRAPFWFACLLALNAHFFFLFPIGVSIGHQFILCRSRRERVQISLTSLTLGLIFVLINSQAFFALISNPPSSHRTTDLLYSIPQFGRNIEHLVRFVSGAPDYRALLGSFILLVANLLFLKTKKDPPVVPLTTLIAIPALFVIASLKSKYEMSDRYLLPFYGLIILCVRNILIALSKQIASISLYVPRRVAPLFLFAALFISIFLKFSPAAAATKVLLKKDFTAHFRFFQTIAKEQKPILMIHSLGWLIDVQWFYEVYVLPNHFLPTPMLSFAPPKNRQIFSNSKTEIDIWLEANHDGRVYLAHFDRSQISPKPTQLRLSERIEVNLIQIGREYVWELTGAQHFEDVLAVMRMVKYPGTEENWGQYMNPNGLMATR